MFCRYTVDFRLESEAERAKAALESAVLEGRLYGRKCTASPRNAYIYYNRASGSTGYYFGEDHDPMRNIIMPLGNYYEITMKHPVLTKEERLVKIHNQRILLREE